MEEKSKIKNNSLKILGIQMSSTIGDKEANFHKIMDLINKNIKKGTDIIFLPEVWNVGWKPSIFKDYAENLNSGSTLEFLSEMAIAYNTNIIGGSYITEKEGKFFNTCPVINKDGELVTTYDKMHLFSYYGCDEGKFIENGKNPVLINFDTETRKLTLEDAEDSVKIGLSICYDIRFPEIYRAYRKGGADLLVNMAAWPLSRAVHWESLTKARAIENQSFMIALTQSGLIECEEWNLGHSRVIDFNGEVLSEIKDNKEGAMFADIKFDEMYKFREKCTVLLDIHDKYVVK